jgi:hypothetical protein
MTLAVIGIAMPENCSRLNSKAVDAIAQLLWKIPQAKTDCLAEACS